MQKLVVYQMRYLFMDFRGLIDDSLKFKLMLLSVTENWKLKRFLCSAKVRALKVFEMSLISHQNLHFRNW